jgi:predicted permease
MTAVLSLAVGIGVNTAIFSTLNAVLLRELPVRSPRELRVLNWAGPPAGDYHIMAGEESHRTGRHTECSGMFPYPVYCTFRDRGEGFSEAFAFSQTEPLTVVARGHAFTAKGLLVTGNFFTGYGTHTLIGRTTTPEDDLPTAEPVAVITYRVWERCFALDPNVIGQAAMLNGHGVTIIGVLPRDHVGPLVGDEAEVYLPLYLQARFLPDFSLASPRDYWLHVMVRLRPGTTGAQAKASLEVLWRQHTRDHPPKASDCEHGPATLLLVNGRRGPVIDRGLMSGGLRQWMEIGGLLLLIACVNLAGLLLARNAAREHEMAIRATLGAGRWRLVRQSLVESLCLSAAGGLLGVVLAWWGKGVLQNLLPRLFWRLSDTPPYVHFDMRTDPVVLMFTLGCVLATALLVGLLPGLLDARINPGTRLRSPRVRGAPRLRLGKALVVAQIAMSLTLVAGTGLLLHSLVNLYRIELGFNPKNLLVFHLNAAQAGYEDPKRTRFYEEVNQVMALLPGVRSAAFADQCHIGAGWGTHFVSVPDRSIQRLQTTYVTVNDTFFETLGIPLLLGRRFSDLDVAGPVRSAIVNQTFCRAAFAGENPIGRLFKVGDQNYQIVGVCGDARYYALHTSYTIWPMTYFSYRQTPVPETWFALRTAIPPQTLMPQVRKAMTALDPLIPVTITTQSELIDGTIRPERLYAGLGVFLALLAVALSCIGVYGLMAHNVALRTAEIGIRMAIGARPQDVSRTILREALLLAGLGVGIGVPLSLMTVRVIRWILYGVTPYDPATLGAAVIVLIGVALLAAWIPARRAAKLDPMAALRLE